MIRQTFRSSEHLPASIYYKLELYKAIEQQYSMIHAIYAAVPFAFSTDAYFQVLV
jgi:hypothetical protein